MRTLALILPLALGLSTLSRPAFADVADDSGNSTGDDAGDDGGDDGDDDDDDDDSGEDDDDDDKGCMYVAANPVTGLSLVLGVGLVLGLRRRD